jgi:hypothetical protein
MFCRSMEKGELARRLLIDDGDDAPEAGGEEGEVD